MLGYKPNRWSYDNVHSRTERFITGTTCRQVGKTWTAAIEIDEGMTQPVDANGEPPWVGLIAPSYAHCDLVVNRYLQWIDSAFGKDAYAINQNKHVLSLRDPAAGTPGARLQWISADDPMYSMGFTFSKLLFDEAQRVPDDVFYKARPTASVREAQIIAFGTPDVSSEQSWFRGMFLRGTDPEDTAYHSFNVTCYENNHISREEIKEAQSTLTEREFRMLYLGEWVGDEGGVFTNIDAAVIAKPPVYDPRKRYVMGVDLAIFEDFNVVLVGEAATRTVIHMDRWNMTDSVVSIDRIANIYEQFGKPSVYADETGGIGISQVAEIRKRGIPVHGININAGNKMPMIGRLAQDIEHRRIMFPAYKPLLSEMRSFVYKRTPSGRLTASAVSSFHDDCVMALVLLREGMARGSAAGTSQGNYLAGGNQNPYRDMLRAD